MFDIGWAEMLVIAIVLIVVVGPKDLPKMLRTFGKTTAKMRGMAGEFRKQFDEAMKEAELEDLKSIAKDARKLNPASDIKKALSPVEKAAQDVRAGLDKAMKPDAPKPASAEPKPAAPLKPGAAAMPGETATKTPPGKPAAVAAAKPNGSSAPAVKPARTAAKPAAARKASSRAPAAKPKTAAKAPAASRAAPQPAPKRTATARKAAAPKSGGDAS